MHLHGKTDNQGTRFRLDSGFTDLTAAHNIHDLSSVPYYFGVSILVLLIANLFS